MVQNNGSQGDRRQRINILLVDDQTIFREGLKTLLQSEPDFIIVGTADHSQRALEQVKTLQPDVAIVDRDVPGLEAAGDVQSIRQQFSGTQVLVLHRSSSKGNSANPLSVGDGSYLPKDIAPAQLKEAIRLLYKHSAKMPSSSLATAMPAGQIVPSSSAINLVSLRSTPGTLAKLPSPPRSGKLVSRRQGKDNLPPSALAVRSQSQLVSSEFDQAIILRQSPTWSRSIIWLILVLLASIIGWAYFANIEQVVSANGQLKPQGKVKEVEVPVGGVNSVVKEVYVREGDRVQKGQALLILDSDASEVELESSQRIRQSLRQENQFYRTLMKQSLETTDVEIAIAKLNLPKEIASLTRDRTELVAENKLFQVEVGNSQGGGSLNSQQQQRLQASRIELDSRKASAQLQVAQLQQQLEQNRVLLKDAQLKLKTQEKILSEIQPLVEEGAFARIQYLEQEQEVSTRKAEVDQLQEEQQRLKFAIEQAREELTNTAATTQKDVLTQIANNQKQIANIDSQLNRRILDNEKRIAELNSQISRAQQTLKYQELRAPVSGTVFDLQAAPGFVPKGGPEGALLKIVPDDNLVAEVFIRNEDIGFVRQGMHADVRIASFPYTEFGDIKGKVTTIGSDALPPDNDYDFYRFPTKISLERQKLSVDGRELPLQSGMSVNVSITVREKRTVLSLVTEMFTREVESIKEIK